MDVRVCRNCRRLFNYVFGPEICPECSKAASESKLEPTNEVPKGNVLTAALNPLNDDEELKFQQVRDYIMNNPRATVAKIAEVNEITPSKLFEWIRDDRLEFTDDSSYAWFICEKCGTRIRSGRLCNRCK